MLPLALTESPFLMRHAQAHASMAQANAYILMRRRARGRTVTALSTPTPAERRFAPHAMRGALRRSRSPAARAHAVAATPCHVPAPRDADFTVDIATLKSADAPYAAAFAICAEALFSCCFLSMIVCRRYSGTSIHIIDRADILFLHFDILLRDVRFRFFARLRRPVFAAITFDISFFDCFRCCGQRFCCGARKECAPEMDECAAER